MTRTLTSNKPSCTRPTATTHTLWLARCGCRLRFGIDNIGLRRQSRRHRALSRCSRSSGLQMTWNPLGGSSSRSTLMLVNQMMTVSSSQQFHFLCLLILRSQAGPLNLNHGFDVFLEFLGCKSPMPLPFTLLRVEFANTDTVLCLPTFPASRGSSLLYLSHPPTCTDSYLLFRRSSVICILPFLVLCLRWICPPRRLPVIHDCTCSGVCYIDSAGNQRLER